MKKLTDSFTKKENVLKKKLTSMLDLPNEIIFNLPLISILGNEEMSIENYKGVIEYSEEKIRINTTSGMMRIEGKNLLIKQITAENIVVTGLISRFEYIM